MVNFTSSLVWCLLSKRCMALTLLSLSIQNLMKTDTSTCTLLVWRVQTWRAGHGCPTSQRPSEDPNLLFESVVNDIDNPTIFVVFFDP